MKAVLFCFYSEGKKNRGFMFLNRIFLAVTILLISCSPQSNKEPKQNPREEKADLIPDNETKIPNPPQELTDKVVLEEPKAEKDHPNEVANPPPVETIQKVDPKTIFDASWQILPLPERMQRRIQNGLRKQYQAKVLLPASVYLVHPDGRNVAFTLAEYSQYEACMNEQKDDPEAKKRCRQVQAQDSTGRQMSFQPCTVRKLVRTDFVAPKHSLENLSTGDHWGEMTLRGESSLPGKCVLINTRSFRFEDLDQDQSPEIVIDLLTKTIDRGFRGEEQYDIIQRALFVFRSDLSEQFSHIMSEADCGGDGLSCELTAHREAFADANGDGYIDLKLEQVEYTSLGDCQEDEIGWPKLVQDAEDECSGEVVTHIWQYEPKQDTWLKQ